MRSVKCLGLAGLMLSLGLTTGCATKNDVKEAMTETMKPFVDRLDRNVNETKRSRADIDELKGKVAAIETVAQNKLRCLKDCPPEKPVGVIRPAATARRTVARATTQKPTAKPAAKPAPTTQTAQAASAQPPAPAAPPAAPSLPLRMDFPKEPPFQPSQNAAQFQDRERETRQPVSSPEPPRKRRWWQISRPSVCEECPCDCEKKTRS